MTYPVTCGENEMTTTLEVLELVRTAAIGVVLVGLFQSIYLDKKNSCAKGFLARDLVRMMVPCIQLVEHDDEHNRVSQRWQTILSERDLRLDL
jgi:hypothetical protein